MSRAVEGATASGAVAGTDRIGTAARVYGARREGC